MTTLATMKDRIANEVARSDLDAMIANAINDAIDTYQPKRFYFTETRDITFDTVDGQEWYDKFDHASIPHLLAIDYVKITVDGTLMTLGRTAAENLELSPDTASGQPNCYAYYGQQMRLYPVPTGSWEVRIAAHVKIDGPADDDEKNNPWMTEAERLIRACAKANLAEDVNASGLEPSFSDKAVLKFQAAEKRALDQLKGRTARQVGTGRIKGMD